jgi:hypothetical protein
MYFACISGVCSNSRKGYLLKIQSARTLKLIKGNFQVRNHLKILWDFGILNIFCITNSLGRRNNGEETWRSNEYRWRGLLGPSRHPYSFAPPDSILSPFHLKLFVWPKNCQYIPIHAKLMPHRVFSGQTLFSTFLSCRSRYVYLWSQGRRWWDWYVSNVSIIFDAPCLFLHHLLSVLLHFMAFLCIFRN